MAAVVKKYESTISLTATGEVTGDSFTGKFTFKTRLSHRERLQIDTLRRQLLGAQPDGAIPSERALQTTQAFADLQVRVTDAPSWWTNASNGMDLSDDDVVAAVYDAAIKAELDERNVVKKAAEDAKKDLQTEEPPAA